MDKSAKKITGSFAITSQPLSTFYKDEGGKKNCLITVIKVENLRTNGTPINFDKMIYVPAVATICYESGEEVEEKHQYILKLVNESGPHTLNVPADGTEKKILFRIDKVSRRFDSRKFVVRFSAQESGALAGNHDFSALAETTTTPVEVFSKRKISKKPNAHDPNPKKRRRFVQIAKASELDQLKAKYEGLFQEIRTTLQAQQKQINKLVYMLESRTITRSNTMPDRLGIGGAPIVVRPPRLVGLDFPENAVSFNFGPPTPIDTPPALEKYPAAKYLRGKIPTRLSR